MYRFKRGDIIYYPDREEFYSQSVRHSTPKGLYSVGEVEIEINQHGIDLGHTQLYLISERHLQLKIEPMNQFVDYDLKEKLAYLIDTEMVDLLGLREMRWERI